MAGRVILIEGLDLAGKSTLVRNLRDELTRRGIPGVSYGLAKAAKPP